MNSWLAVPRILAAAAAILLGTTAPLAALERGMFGWRGAEAIGNRPLLVIWLREPDGMPQGEIDKYTRYFHEAIFGRETLPAANHFDLSIAGYYREISSGKFSFARAGLLGPLVAQVKGKPAGEVARLAIEDAGRQGAFAFKPFDSNHDGRIERDELAVLVIANATPPGRRWEDFSPPARNIADRRRGCFICRPGGSRCRERRVRDRQSRIVSRPRAGCCRSFGLAAAMLCAQQRAFVDGGE